MGKNVSNHPAKREWLKQGEGTNKIRCQSHEKLAGGSVAENADWQVSDQLKWTTQESKQIGLF